MRTRVDEIYNSQKAYNHIKEVLPECLILFVGVLLEILALFVGVVVIILDVT